MSAKNEIKFNRESHWMLISNINDVNSIEGSC